jgi:hypothetical protein
MTTALNFPALPRFLNYLEEAGITNNLAEIEVNKQRKCYEHMEVFPLIYLCKIMVGIENTQRQQRLQLPRRQRHQPQQQPRLLQQDQLDFMVPDGFLMN